jgi:hypothetical protein
MATPRVGGAHCKARVVNNKILRDEHGMPYFLRASQNIATTAVRM